MARHRPKRRRIGVAALAAYAADPRGYLERRGRAADPQAAGYGERAHEAAGKTPRRHPLTTLIAVIAALAALAVAAWHFFAL